MNIIKLYVNSKDRIYKSDTITNFSIQLNDLGVNQSIKGYRINNVSLPKSEYYTIYPPNDNTNNQTFTLNDGGIVNVLIKVGNYTISQLISELQTKLNLYGSQVYTVTYDSITNKINISAVNPFQIAFSSNNAKYTYQAIGFILGWHDGNGNILNVTSTTSATSPRQVVLSGSLNYFIKSSVLTTYKTCFFNNVSNNVIFSIPNSGNLYEIIYYQNSNNIFNNVNNIVTNVFDFVLCDDYEKEPSLMVDWSFEIDLLL